MKKLLVLTAAALIFQATPVLAEHHEGSGKKGKMFAKYDTNNDGVISESEFMAKAKEKFSKMDANGDGNVTKEERKTAHEAKRSERKDKRQERKEKRPSPAE